MEHYALTDYYNLRIIFLFRKQLKVILRISNGFYLCQDSEEFGIWCIMCKFFSQETWIFISWSIRLHPIRQNQDHPSEHLLGWFLLLVLFYLRTFVVDNLRVLLFKVTNCCPYYFWTYVISSYKSDSSLSTFFHKILLYPYLQKKVMY